MLCNLQCATAFYGCLAGYNHCRTHRLSFPLSKYSVVAGTATNVSFAFFPPAVLNVPLRHLHVRNAENILECYAIQTATVRTRDRARKVTRKSLFDLLQFSLVRRLQWSSPLPIYCYRICLAKPDVGTILDRLLLLRRRMPQKVFRFGCRRLPQIARHEWRDWKQLLEASWIRRCTRHANQTARKSLWLFMVLVLIKYIFVVCAWLFLNFLTWLTFEGIRRVIRYEIHVRKQLWNIWGTGSVNRSRIYYTFAFTIWYELGKEIRLNTEFVWFMQLKFRKFIAAISSAELIDSSSSCSVPVFHVIDFFGLDSFAPAVTFSWQRYLCVHCKAKNNTDTSAQLQSGCYSVVHDTYKIHCCANGFGIARALLICWHYHPQQR